MDNVDYDNIRFMNDKLVEEFKEEISYLRELIVEIEGKQRGSNVRIRQDIMKSSVGASMTSLAVIFMWAGVEPRWWFIFAPMLLVPLMMSIDDEKITKQEVPRF